MTRHLITIFSIATLLFFSGCGDDLLNETGSSTGGSKSGDQSNVETVALRHPEVMPLKNIAAADLPEIEQTGDYLDVTLPNYDPVETTGQHAEESDAEEGGHSEEHGDGTHADETHGEEGHSEEPPFQPVSQPVSQPVIQPSNPNNRPVSSGSASTKVVVRLRTPTALPQTLPSGTAMGFSVDYVFESGEPNYKSEYAWIVTNGRGEQFVIPVELKREGVLQQFVPWRPRDKPFKSVLAEKPPSGPPREISRTVDMVMVGGH